MFLSAYLSEDGLQILPPREHYYFNRNIYIDTDPALVHKVATYFILTQEEAIEQVSYWENRILEKTQKENVRFGKYGVFQFDNQLDFISDSLLIYDWLPAISYQTTGAYVQQLTTKEPLQNTSLVNRETKRKRKVLFPVLWSVLACLFVFALFFWSEPLSLLMDRNAEFNTRLVNVAPKSYSVNETMDYFSDTHDMKSIDANAEERTDGIKKISEPAASVDNTSTLPEDNEPPLNEDSFASTSDSKEKKEVPAVDKRTESSVECTLIVGAFANRDNVDRMVARLKNMNVEVITIERQTLTLVGAQVKCEDRAQINQLKNQIEPNAWVYKK